MNCNIITARLTAWIDGELAPQEAEALRAHVAACSSCAAEYAEQLEFHRQTQAWAEAEASPDTDLWGEIEATLVREEIAALQAQRDALRTEVETLRQQAARLRIKPTGPQTADTPVLFPNVRPPANPNVWL